LVANFEFSSFTPKQKYRLDCSHGNGLYCKILTEKETSRAQGFATGLGLPYNNTAYLGPDLYKKCKPSNGFCMVYSTYH